MNQHPGLLRMSNRHLPPEQARIAHLAEVARRALESVDPSKLSGELGTEFAKFPLGACGDSSIVLGQLLKEHGLGDFWYMNGRRYSPEGFGCHSWVQQGDLIIDITGDQFPGRPKVFVGEGDPWFAQFEDVDPAVASINMWGPRWFGQLSGLYDELLANVPPADRPLVS